jgi:hypothetical protein
MVDIFFIEIDGELCYKFIQRFIFLEIFLQI